MLEGMELFNNPEALHKAVAATGLTENAFDENDIIDEGVLNWYKSRFTTCAEDGVREAMTCYLHHACNRQDINDITKVAIMQLYLSI